MAEGRMFMALDELQKPNIGTPEFARRRGGGGRKLWAIVTTVAFALFWIYGLFIAASAFGGQPMHWSAPVLCALGLGGGLLARRQVERP